MRGFFEPIVKIGLGVAFGWSIIHTIGPMSDHAVGWLGEVISGPWWTWLLFPLFLVLGLGAIITSPLLLLAVFLLPIMRLITGKWFEPLNLSEKSGREYSYFLIVWIYSFWAVLGNFE